MRWFKTELRYVGYWLLSVSCLAVGLSLRAVVNSLFG